jgi:hypothetical protein
VDNVQEFLEAVVGDFDSAGTGLDELGLRRPDLLDISKLFSDKPGLSL